uniref:Secreted protein n=1 Tax=Arion vulgaris TaxID=1028688 RepID=A0A0B7A149_9EUPU
MAVGIHVLFYAIRVHVHLAVLWSGLPVTVVKSENMFAAQLLSASNVIRLVTRNSTVGFTCAKMYVMLAPALHAQFSRRKSVFAQ